MEDCRGSVELAQSKSQAKHVYRYWKIRGVKGKSDVTIHPEKYQLDIAKYKAELFTCIKPILVAYGIGAGDLKLQSELVDGKVQEHQQ